MESSTDLTVPDGLARLAVWLATRPDLAPLVRDALTHAARHPDLADAIAHFLPTPPAVPTTEPIPHSENSPADAELVARLELAASPEWLAPAREAFAALATALQRPESADAVTLAATALDRLTAAACPPGSVHEQEAVLDAVRAWAERFGLNVTPAGWSFAHLNNRDSLDETTSIAAVFRNDAPKGVVYRVRTFGLQRGDENLRPCAVSISAGPPPAGLAELEEAVKSADGEAWEWVRQRLRAWRLAGLDGNLEEVAVQLYVDFWGEPGEPLARAEPDRAALVGELLQAVLEQAFTLQTFWPKNYLDLPDGWAVRVNRRGMVSGRVTRILRAGLRDADGELRVPALVDVE